MFPDDKLDTISNIEQLMEEARFDIFDVEGLQPHHAITVRHWIKRLEEKHDEVVHLLGEWPIVFGGFV